MKVLIVSDTHRHNDNLLIALEKAGKIDMLIHCGDAEGTEEQIRELINCPMCIVAGNNDFFTRLQTEAFFELEGHKIMVTHGHYHHVSVGVEHLVRDAITRGADIVIYGHTHRPMMEIKNGVVVLNPGSISYPRQDGRIPTYMIMEIDKFGDIHYTLRYIC